MKILVGLSGGFDSAFTAYHLMRAGHTVEGAALEMHDYTELSEARATAAALGFLFMWSLAVRFLNARSWSTFATSTFRRGRLTHASFAMKR